MKRKEKEGMKRKERKEKEGNARTMKKNEGKGNRHICIWKSARVMS